MYRPRLVSGDESSVVRFICDQDVLNGPPTLAATNGNTYEFEFRTSLACLPRVVDCRLLGADGLEYDLSSLRRTDADWQVRDRRDRCVCMGAMLAAVPMQVSCCCENSPLNSLSAMYQLLLYKHFELS